MKPSNHTSYRDRAVVNNPESQPAPILIAEDNIDDALLTRVVFERARILNPLQFVEDGDAALQYLNGEGVYQEREKFPYPVLFLLDLKMPRKGGMDVLRSISSTSQHRSLPAVIIAGAGEMREVNCAYSLGARSFLVKPLTYVDLMELITCFRELRFIAKGDSYIIAPAQTLPRPAQRQSSHLKYQPQPLDTSRLKLTDDVLRLTELLAENNHEVWARDRIAQGWTYGPKRDDDRKEHPCLVPYRDLPESEKVFDRNTALETIKTILSFGLPEPVLEKTAEAVRSEAVSKYAAVLKKQDLTPTELRRVWDERNTVLWGQSTELYHRSIEMALHFGEAFLAFDMASEGLKKFSHDVRLRQMQALSLAKTGASRTASEILEQLRSAGNQDEQTLGLLAQTYKDFWMIATEAGQRRRHLKLSFELYTQAYRRNGGYRSGLHAAAMGMIYGEKNIACQIAREVAHMCRSALTHPDLQSFDPYPLQATLAEASLILGDIAAAAEQYQSSSASAGHNWFVVNRTRAQARLLLKHTGRKENELDRCFTLPQIAVCSGHMFDKPERRKRRFPFGLEMFVREQMRKKVAELDARIGFSSLACGADMLFAEAILEQGGELNIVLPCNRGDFKAQSVDIIPGSNLAERFDNILARAASITILDDTITSVDPASFEYCNEIVIGQALLKGRFLGLDVVPLAVWDGQGGDGRGGTENFIRFWEQRSTPVEVIRIDQILDEIAQREVFPAKEQPHGNEAEVCVQPATVTGPISPHETKAILFAEIHGLGRLPEQQSPALVHDVLTRVSGLVESSRTPPIVKQTWGSAIHCVFNHVTEAAEFALALQDLVRKTDWTSFGFTTDVHLRIGLHAGPVYPCIDPVSKAQAFLGSHINRTARIDPIAEEGQIYASEAFAALSEVTGTKQYTCDYVGQKQLTRRYDMIPAFIVRRRLPADSLFPTDT